MRQCVLCIIIHQFKSFYLIISKVILMRILIVRKLFLEYRTAPLGDFREKGDYFLTILQFVCYFKEAGYL